MKNESNIAKKLNLITSIGFYLASLGFFISAIIGNYTLYIPLGVTFLSIGTLFLILSIRRNKNDEDTKK